METTEGHKPNAKEIAERLAKKREEKAKHYELHKREIDNYLKLTDQETKLCSLLSNAILGERQTYVYGNRI